MCHPTKINDKIDIVSRNAAHHKKLQREEPSEHSTHCSIVKGLARRTRAINLAHRVQLKEVGRRTSGEYSQTGNAS